jgi:hypothetical protein
MLRISRFVGRQSIKSSETLTAGPVWPPRGKGDFMDRLSSPSDDCNRAPESNGADLTGYSIDGSYGPSFVQWDQTSELTGRTDIDSAMVEALRCALAVDRGPPGSGWEASEQDQLGDVRRSADLRALTTGPPDLARRFDIDLAVLDALRHAMGPEPEVPGA